MNNNDSKELQQKYFDSISKAVHELCEKEKDKHDNALETFEIYRARLELDALKSGKVILDGWINAFKVIIAELANAGDQHSIQELIRGIDNLKKHQASAKRKKEEVPLVGIFGFSEQLMEKIYQIGRNSFEHGHFADAAKVFSLVVTLDPGYSVGWIALGIILNMEKYWNESIAAFSVASQIDTHNPLPYLYSARCHKNLGQKDQARESLKLALATASSQPQYVTLVSSIKNEQNQL